MGEDIINRYFAGVVLLKVENKEGFSIYSAALNSSYGDGKKQYLLAFVPDHLAILEKAYLSDLQWENVQTRTLTNGYKLPTGHSMPQQKWTVPRDVGNFMFNIINRDEHKSRYSAEGHALELVLIHDPKKKSQYQYHNKMNLVAALATFRCVISRIHSPHFRGTPVSSLSSNPMDRKILTSPPRENPEKISPLGASGRKSYQTSSSSLKETIRYQSVAAQTLARPQPISPIREPGVLEEPVGRGTYALPLGATKIKRQTNHPHPWIGRGIPSPDFSTRTGARGTPSNIYNMESGNDPKVLRLPREGGDSDSESDKIDSSFDLIQ